VSELFVPAPSLVAELSAPGLAVLEKPVPIAAGAVTLPDGTPLTDQTLGIIAGFFLHRRKGSSITEAWDETQKQWLVPSDAQLMTLKPKPLAYKKDTGAWEGLFVPSADKDAVEAGTTTEYLVRTFFQAPFGGSPLAALSAQSSSIRFVAMIDAVQAGLKIEAPESATEVTVFLRDAAKQEIGSVLLIKESGSARIELSNSTGAYVRITGDGDILLRSSLTRHVYINGSLVA
jgi:hypothetical protein